MSTDAFLELTENVRLDEMSRDEFRDVTRRLSPGVTEAEIEKNWLEFQSLKRAARATRSAYLWQ